MSETTDDDFKHYLAQRVIPDLQQEGFDTSLKQDNKDDYITLTIQRKQHYY
jgi:hypothetical protein